MRLLLVAVCLALCAHNVLALQRRRHSASTSKTAHKTQAVIKLKKALGLENKESYKLQAWNLRNSVASSFARSQSSEAVYVKTLIVGANLAGITAFLHRPDCKSVDDIPGYFRKRANTPENAIPCLLISDGDYQGLDGGLKETRQLWGVTRIPGAKFQPEEFRGKTYTKSYIDPLEPRPSRTRFATAEAINLARWANQAHHKIPILTAWVSDIQPAKGDRKGLLSHEVAGILGELKGQNFTIFSERTILAIGKGKEPAPLSREQVDDREEVKAVASDGIPFVVSDVELINHGEGPAIEDLSKKWLIMPGNTQNSLALMTYLIESGVLPENMYTFGTPDDILQNTYYEKSRFWPLLDVWPKDQKMNADGAIHLLDPDFFDPHNLEITTGKDLNSRERSFLQLSEKTRKDEYIDVNLRLAPKNNAIDHVVTAFGMTTELMDPLFEPHFTAQIVFAPVTIGEDAFPCALRASFRAGDKLPLYVVGTATLPMKSRYPESMMENRNKRLRDYLDELVLMNPSQSDNSAYHIQLPLVHRCVESFE